jgi:hypothetical protein
MDHLKAIHVVELRKSVKRRRENQKLVTARCREVIVGLNQTC